MTEHLSDQQTARLEALQGAAPLIGRRSDGAFKAVEPRDVNELVDVAEYIIAGVHPMDSYRKTLRRCYLCGGDVPPLAGTNVCDDHDTPEDEPL